MSHHLGDGVAHALLLLLRDVQLSAEGLQDAQSRLQRRLGLLKRQICGTDTSETHIRNTHTHAHVDHSLTQLVSVVDPGQELHDPQLEDGVSASIHGQHHHTCDDHMILMRIMSILGFIIHILHTQRRRQTSIYHGNIWFHLIKFKYFSNLDTTHIVVKTRGSISVICNIVQITSQHTRFTVNSNL